MTDPMNVLHTYAQEQLVSTLLAKEDGYNETHRCVEKLEQELYALVGEGNEEQLEALLEEQSLLASLYGRTLFRAGFQIALELLTNPA